MDAKVICDLKLYLHKELCYTEDKTTLFEDCIFSTSSCTKNYFENDVFPKNIEI